MKRFPKHIVAAAGIVENGRGEVLLIKTPSGGWVWTGGQVENGENLIEAVLREIYEESGVRADVKELVTVISSTASHPGHSGYEDVPTKVIFDFSCTYLSGELLLRTDETVEARWVDKYEAMTYITHPAYRARYEAYLQYGGHVRYLSCATYPDFRLDISREL